MMMPEQELEVLPGYDQDSLEVLRLLTSAGFTVSSVRCRRPTELRRKTNDESQKAECTQQRCFHRAVRCDLQAIHHIWAAETQLCQTRSLYAPPPLSLAPILPLPWFAPLIPCPHPLILFSPSPPKTSFTLQFPLTIFHYLPSSFHLTRTPISAYCLPLGRKHNHLFICFLFPFLCSLFILVNIKLPAGKECESIWCWTYKSK